MADDFRLNYRRHFEFSAIEVREEWAIKAGRRRLLRIADRLRESIIYPAKDS